MILLDGHFVYFSQPVCTGTSILYMPTLSPSPMFSLGQGSGNWSPPTAPGS